MDQTIRRAAARAFVFVVVCILCVGLTACYSSSTQKQSTKQSVSSLAETTHVKKTYSDIPTAYPNLYMYDPDSGLRNIYNENMVVGWEEAGNYVGQTVTVEGPVDSVVHATSVNGSPYFFNIGGGAYEGFAIVVWSEDLAKFDQHALRNDVEWSMSDQPMQFMMRASGVVEMYNGRPQITVRDGTQVAQWVNEGWYSLISEDAMDYLMDSLYR